MARDESKETPEERESRLVLNQFLSTTEPVLDRLLKRLVLESKEAVVHRASEHLQQIWASARERLKAVVQAIQTYLSLALIDLNNRPGPDDRIHREIGSTDEAVPLVRSQGPVVRQNSSQP